MISNINRKNKIYKLYLIASNENKKTNLPIGLGFAAGLIFSEPNLYNGRDADTLVPEVINTTEEEPTLEYIEYIIQPGDSIYSISKKFFKGHTDRAVKDIKSKNNLKDSDLNKLKIGQRILIPKNLESFVRINKLEENKHLNATEYIKNFIKEKEGFCPLPEDIEGRGIYTIGYGHRLETRDEIMEYKILNEKMRKNGRKNGELYPNDPEILEIFEKDVKEAEEKIKFNSLPSLSQNQFDSLISFTFNTGYVPDILNDLKNNNIESVYNKIKNHSNESNDTGLIDRRKIEAELFIKDGEIR